MNFSEFYKNNVVILDGGLGTLLQQQGLTAGAQPERWNTQNAAAVIAAHKAYYDAGCNVVSTNTFGANLLKFSKQELTEIVTAAVANAKAAKAQSSAPQEKFIALDIGPTGKMVGALGDCSFEDAVAVFAETVKIGAALGVDLIFIETMNDGYETKAALLAAKENSNLPVFVSNAYGAGGRLMTGATPSVMVAMLEGLGANAVGANCSFGPKALRPVIEELLSAATVPVLFKPNAGLPKRENGVTFYDVSCEDFAKEVCAAVASGVRVAGGCCGTTPAHLSALTKQCKTRIPVRLIAPKGVVAASYSTAIDLSSPVSLSVRLTAQNGLKEAFEEEDAYCALEEAISAEEEGAEILLFAPDRAAVAPDYEFIRAVVSEIHAAVKAPLFLCSEDPQTIETVLRIYNGKPLLLFPQNKDAQAAALAAAKKYGAVLVGEVSGITPPVSQNFAEFAQKSGVKAQNVLSVLSVKEVLN